MPLLTTARALDDNEFRWRVMAACWIKAGNFPSMTGNPKNFALSVLLNPQNVDASMLAFVAMDSVVSAAITVQDDTVDSSAVADADITRVVEAKWDVVANKYTTNPLTA